MTCCGLVQSWCGLLQLPCQEATFSLVLLSGANLIFSSCKTSLLVILWFGKACIDWELCDMSNLICLVQATCLRSSPCRSRAAAWLLTIVLNTTRKVENLVNNLISLSHLTQRQTSYSTPNFSLNAKLFTQRQTFLLNAKLIYSTPNCLLNAEFWATYK